MAINPYVGKLSTAQALGSGTPEISLGIINIGSLEDVPDDTWLDIETAVLASGSGALTIDLEIGDAVGLDGTNLKILTVVIAAQTDKRILTAGAHILGCSLPREVRELAEQLGYDYLGLRYTPTSSLALSVNAVITVSQPRTRDKKVTVVSPVGVPTASGTIT